jgi:hypothetical protein
MRAKQAEVAAAQEKLALQSGREESFKKMLADAQEVIFCHYTISC